MIKNLEFKMQDNLIIKGQIEGNLESDNLIVMLHSGGYDRHERGVKEIKENQKIYYNPLGNYDYLVNLLKQDYTILRIDQRNHGQSGKNIDIDKLSAALNQLDVTGEDIKKIVRLELARDKKGLGLFITKYPKIKKIVNKPPIKDLSFIQMKDDLAEVMKALPQKIGKEFKTIDYVGTCMGTVVLGLYLKENIKKANSLTLFSPLYTFDYSFTNTPEDAGLLAKKKQVIESGKQFRLGNAVEGKSTYDEVARFSDEFIENLKNLDIPTYCIQGTSDVLVPEQEQLKLFTEVIKNRLGKGLSEVYYAKIEGVHCLYDSLYPCLVEVSDFINGNHQLEKTI